MQQAPLFEVNAVSKIYRLRPSFFPWMEGTDNNLIAVRDVSLNIFEGEVFGIIGESGSGKSTLGYILADIEPPSRGLVKFRGRCVSDMNNRERLAFRRKVQTVFQDSGSALNPRRRIGAILRDSVKLSGRRLHKDVVAELLVRVGLSEEHGSRYPHQLSGGQRQRVGIARALAMQPEVIIADEPASALDVSLQGQIINLLLSLRRKLNITIVLISHDIALIQHASDRLAVMRDGSVVEAGIAAEVIASPRDAYTKALVAAVPKGFDLQSGGADQSSVQQAIQFTDK